MQHYGNRRDEEKGVDLSAEEAMRRIEALLVDCRRDYKVAKIWMEDMYKEE